MSNLIPFVIMIVIMTLLAIACTLLLSAYMSTLNFKESILLIYAEFHFHTHKKLKIDAYKAVHNHKIKHILTQISSTADKDLVNANPQLTIQDAKQIKLLAGNLLKKDNYLIDDKNAKRDLKELGLNSFIYSFQMRLAFASDPNNQFIYSKFKQKSARTITNKQQFHAKRKQSLLKNRSINSNLDEKLLGAMITFDSIIQKLFKNKDKEHYAINV